MQSQHQIYKWKMKLIENIQPDQLYSMCTDIDNQASCDKGVGM